MWWKNLLRAILFLPLLPVTALVVFALRQRDLFKEQWSIIQLKKTSVPKLAKAEQFRFLDGRCSSEGIARALGMQGQPPSVFGNFFDVQPDEYLEHLRANDPPRSWVHGVGDYEHASIEQDGDNWTLIQADRGSEFWSMEFDSYDQLLKYLVYARLTRLARKYRKQMSKSYFEN